MAFAAKNKGRRTDATTQWCVCGMLMYSYSIAFVSQKTLPACAHAVNRHEMSPRMLTAKHRRVHVPLPVNAASRSPRMRACQGAEANATPLRVGPDGVIVFHSQLSISIRVALRIQCVCSVWRQARRTATLKTNGHAPTGMSATGSMRSSLLEDLDHAPCPPCTPLAYACPS